MPQCASVSVEYGPYEACGIVEHRTARLQGLQTQLTRSGHTVTLKTIPDWNILRLVVNGERVFQCKVTDLDHGGDGLLNPFCAEAVQCVAKAY